MQGYLRQGSPATVNFGRFVNPSDGITPYGSATLAPQLSANGGAFAARHSATSISYQQDGYYAVPLDATDTAAVGRLKVEVPGSPGNYLPVEAEYAVLPQPVYDSLFGGSPLATIGTGANQIAVDGSGNAHVLGPFKLNAASGFEFAMFQSGSTSGYTGGNVAATREIAGTGTTAAAGTVTQVGSTNRYYFAGTSADFGGANVTFTFAASGAQTVTVSINTTP